MIQGSKKGKTSLTKTVAPLPILQASHLLKLIITLLSFGFEISVNFTLFKLEKPYTSQTV